MDPITLGAAKLGANEAATKMLDILFDALSAQAKKKWKALRNSQQVSRMATRFNDLRMVKTIWEPDRPSDLTQFYVPGHVQMGDGRRPLNSISDLPACKKLTIQGTVGLGKSMLMRWLAWREIGFGNRVPIFVELRKLSMSKTLLRAVLEEMEVLGLYGEEELFEALASQGALVLLLDGFDELHPDLVTTVANDIEELSRKNSELRVVISTRPDSAACHLAGFSVCALSPLLDDEYIPVLRKLEPDPTSVESILSALAVEESSVESLLSTPLMVALLVLKFRADYEVPDNELAFYSGLFDLLARRHDRSKGGFLRYRKSGLSNPDLNEAFDAFSYLTRRSGRYSFSRRQAWDTAGQALQRVGIRADAEAFVSDIAEVTCLLLFDSDEGRFVHRSVQEFHTASFISRLPDVVARKFYLYLLDKWTEWQEELRFLPLLDKARFVELFTIPTLERFCEAFADCSDDAKVLSRFLDVYGTCEVGYDLSLHVSSIAWHDPAPHSWLDFRLFPTYSEVLKNLGPIRLGALRSGNDDDAYRSHRLREIADASSGEGDLKPLVEFVYHQRRELDQARRDVKERYEFDDLLPESSN